MSDVLKDIQEPLLIGLAIYSILLTLLIVILIVYIIRLRRKSVCRTCKIAFDNESVPLKSNVEPEEAVQPKLNLKYQNDNKNLSRVKTPAKLPSPPDAKVPLDSLEVHHYEEIMDRLKTQQPELYDRVLEPLQRAIRESINIDNKFSQTDSTDQVQCSDMLGHTYEKVIYSKPEDTYDIFVNFPKRTTNYNLKDLQPSSSKSCQNKINQTPYLEATTTKNDSEVTLLKSHIEPEITVQRKFNLESENINEKASPLKTHKKLALMSDYPKKCRKRTDEMETHRYEKIIYAEKTRQSESYKAVMKQFETSLREGTLTDIKQTDEIKEGQYFDMLKHTYETVLYNNPEKVDFKTPERSISFRSSFGVKDHLKYLQPSSSHTSKEDIDEDTYLEAKQFIPTEDCPQKLRSLCSLQNQDRIEEKATSWLPPSRMRTKSDSNVSFKGFFDLFLNIKK